MKSKLARKIFKSAEAGTQQYPLHLLRKAALMVGRPLLLNGTRKNGYNDVYYYPKGLKGTFEVVHCYNPRLFGVYPVGLYKKTDNLWLHEFDNSFGLTMDVSIGSSITNACFQAADFAREYNSKVPFSFNDSFLTGRPHQTGEELQSFWLAESDRKYQEYLASNEYQEYLAKEAKRIAELQVKMDSLVEELDHFNPKVDGLSETDEALMVDWLYNFSDVADNRHLVLDFPAIVIKLQEAGWGDPVTEEERKLIVGDTPDKRLFAKHLFFNAIDMMKIGMPPHPVILHFIDKNYRGKTEPDYEEDFEEEAA